MNTLKGKIILSLLIICGLLIGGYYVGTRLITQKSQQADKEIEARMQRNNTIHALYSFITPPKDVVDTSLLGTWISDTDAIQKRPITWQFYNDNIGLKLKSITKEGTDQFGVKVSLGPQHQNSFEGIGIGTSVFFNYGKEWKVYFYYLKDKNLIIETDGQPTAGTDERLDIVFRRNRL